MTLIDMNNQENTDSGLGQLAAAVISLFLPILQFFYQWLPENLSGIFLSKDIFFFVSLITLILSLLVFFWYKSNPYFRWVPPWQHKQQQKYSQYLKDTDPRYYRPEEIRRVKTESPPFDINATLLSGLSIPLIFIFCIIFVWIGLENIGADPSVHLQVFQSILYILIFVLCTFCGSHYYLLFETQRDWRWANQTKIQRAIQLAIENNGFPEMPRVEYLASGVPQSAGFSPNFAVIVKVKNKRYKITTDQRADILMSVEEHLETSK